MTQREWRQRISETNPTLHAFLSVAESTGWDPPSGGLLDGMIIGIKDNIDTAALPTTYGSVAFAGRHASTDATVVRRVREAGARVIGKTNLAEFGFGGTGQNAHFGDVRNPWDIERIAGGSSSGSAAAVAAGLCDAALGTDTAGSIRLPAALCGVTGLRPSIGRVPVSGVLPVSPSFDVVGPIASTAEDAARVLEAISDHATGSRSVLDGLDDGIAGVRVIRLGGPHFEAVSGEVAQAVEQTATKLAGLKARVRHGSLPGVEWTQKHLTRLVFADAARQHATRLERSPETFDPAVLARLRQGERVSARSYQESQAWGKRWRRQLDRVWRDADVLLCATAPEVAPVRGRGDLTTVSAQLMPLCYGWALARLPAITIPGPRGRSQLPVGVQLVAPHGRDDLLLRVAARLQEASDWHQLPAGLPAQPEVRSR